MGGEEEESRNDQGHGQRHRDGYPGDRVAIAVDIIPAIEVAGRTAAGSVDSHPAPPNSEIALAPAPSGLAVDRFMGFSSPCGGVPAVRTTLDHTP
jgi:hypothetical protein